ncbi:MAG: HlyD family efflux transporter periplasmic adaptor subunit [Lachnospiraceae bacterium]|nr:HlyD family efflux transporter periplasmic adaptor subunit [Lachnospiraceae bacterium]
MKNTAEKRSLKKIRKKAVMVLGIYSVLTLLAFTGCGKKDGIPAGSIANLEAADFTEYIKADGTVECAKAHYVYSTLTLPVEQIFVEEGDHISEGDLLCVLDTESIDEQIELKQAAMDLTERSASTNVEAAWHQYNIYTEGLNNGTDANLVEAMANLQIARETYESAQKAYDDYKESLNLGMDPTLVAADQAVAQAANAIQQAKSMQAELDDEHGVSDIEKEKAEDAVDSANLSYVQAVQSRENLLRQSDIRLADYAKSAEDANLNYITAQTAYNAAVRALENARALSADAIEKAKLTGDLTVDEIQLAQLQNKLLDAQILADHSGTVTAVNIEVGENSTGVLFVIEDTKDLVLTAKVPEKDINSISENMSVLVTPKADNSDTYSGNVKRVAESAYKNASGKTDTSGEDADYKVTVTIDAPDEKIRIGMNAEAEFSVYSKEGCFAVPNEAIFTDENGAEFILTASGDSGKVTLQKSPVTIVYAGKNMSVIEGSDVKNGTRYITEAADYMEYAGSTVDVAD